MLYRAFFRTSEQEGVVAAVVPSPAGGSEGCCVVCRPGAGAGGGAEPGWVVAWVGVGFGAPAGFGGRTGRGVIPGDGCGGCGGPAWVSTASARQGRRAVMGQRTL
jgi:hypothetical protein